MKKICFVTGTRADYGILSPIMKKVAESSEAELQIIATNMHLSQEYGMTVNEIESDGFVVAAKIKSLVGGGDASATVRSMAKVQEGLADVFPLLKPDVVVILGDRYEALAAASAAVVFNIPVAHLHGGETTEGAIDDMFRHAITKLSTYHFASTPQYAEKIISMGEDPEKVFHSGAPGAEGGKGCQEGNDGCQVENEGGLMASGKEETAREFWEKTGLYPGEPFILLAFHPVTLAADKGVGDLKATLEALDEFLTQGINVLATMPNSDPGTCEISQMLREWCGGSRQQRQMFGATGRKILVASLGSKLFHHALDNALAMAGNSSAALIEAPSYRLGAVNVGDRQKGRAHGLTVVDAPGDKEKIIKALNSVLSLEMKAVLMGTTVASLNPYYKEDSAGFIANKLISM